MKSNYKEILVPLDWYELDKISLALRLCNKAFKEENIHDELEEKISNWSMKAKGLK